MNTFAGKFWFFVAASIPVAIGLLISGAQFFQSLNEMQVRGVNDPNELADKQAQAFAATHLGLYVSVPLWILWLVVVLIGAVRRKE